MKTKIITSIVASSLIATFVFAGPPSQSSSPSRATRAAPASAESDLCPTMTRTAATGAKRSKMVVCTPERRANEQRCQLHCR